ncbi:MAG: carbohydrate kinase family protein [Spirochaetaceae bacterium]|jgi:pseudouridine kinase|nr:carbohydrate kinase family protein [Spirochaetaceae bacterium]
MYVTVIGAANMDVNGFSEHAMVMEDSNTGSVDFCAGGVGRNIAENLVHLGAETHLISVFGDDMAGEMLKADSKKIGLDISHSMFVHGSSSIYLAVMDNDGFMKVALCDLGRLNDISIEHLEAQSSFIEKSSIIVIDSNLAPTIQDFILQRFQDIPVYVDPVAVDRAINSVDCIGKFHTIKANRFEASYLTGCPIPAPGEADWKEAVEAAAQKLLDKGIKRVFVSLGKYGSYCRTEEESFFSPIVGGAPVNSSGGGDSFMAGIVWGSLQGWDNKRTTRFASAMSGITVGSKSTVCQNMSVALVEEKISRGGAETRRLQ